MWVIFSSPGLKAQVSFSNCLLTLSVVRLLICKLFIFSSSSLEPPNQYTPKLAPRVKRDSGLFKWMVAPVFNIQRRATCSGEKHLLVQNHWANSTKRGWREFKFLQINGKARSFPKGDNCENTLKYYKNLLHLQRASLGSYKHGEGDSRFLKGHTHLHGEMIAKCYTCSESIVLRAGRLVVLLKLFMPLRSFRTCI